MILKRQEKDGLIKAIYSSSNILASTYDTTTNNLVIIFERGAQYQYENVNKSDYLRFEIAESQGSVFTTHIKKYSFKKLDPINPNLITEEINNIKAAEDKALLDGKRDKLTKTLQKILLALEATGDSNLQIHETILNADLHKLKEQIDDYLTLKK